MKNEKQVKAKLYNVRKTLDSARKAMYKNRSAFHDLDEIYIQYIKGYLEALEWFLKCKERN